MSNEKRRDRTGWIDQEDRLLDQWKMMGAIRKQDGVRVAHLSIAWLLLEQYYGRFGNGEASVSFIQSDTGLRRGTITEATADLVRWGYFTRIMGKGTTATRYAPVWASVPQNADSSVQEKADAASGYENADSSVQQNADAIGHSVQQNADQTHLLVTPTGGDKEESSSGSPGSGLTAAPVAAEDEWWEVTTAYAEHDAGDDLMYVAMVSEGGAVDSVEFYTQHHDSSVQDEGQAFLNRLVDAADIKSIDRAEDLIGARFRGCCNFGHWTFEPAWRRQAAT